MTLAWLIAVLHLLALGIGLGAIFARARSLQTARRRPRLHTILFADNLWAVAGVLWLVTGLWRAFGGLDKGATYYLQNPLFHAKLTLFVIIVLLEIWPMINLIKWRRTTGRGKPVSLAKARKMALVSYLQTLIAIAIVVLAVGIARGM